MLLINNAADVDGQYTNDGQVICTIHRNEPL